VLPGNLIAKTAIVSRIKNMKAAPTHLPALPGVYFFKDAQGRIIYIGKATNIKNRVKSYFNPKHANWKVASLLEDHASVEFILTASELEASLLEAQLISEHKPRYNVLLKDGQPFVYIMCSQDTIPQLKIVRNKKEKGVYFGPFLQKVQARAALSYLINKFRLKLCNLKIDNGCLDFHLDLCAGNCRNDFNFQDYLFRLDLALDALKKNHKDFLKKINAKIAEYNQQHAFEKSKRLYEYSENLETIFAALQARFNPKKFDDAIVRVTEPKNYVASVDSDINSKLQEFLHANQPIITIDCFDISHFQSNQLVGSCIRFKNGKPDKENFRRFKIRSLDQQNDYAALQEIVSRRYKDIKDIPDLIVIDGGKGQLNAVKQIVPHALCISLAKREETIFAPAFPEGQKISLSTDVGRLLIALRDYAHHFAINYHRLRRHKNLESSYAKKSK
jgi:excinuclease ABC subunit C